MLLSVWGFKTAQNGRTLIGLLSPIYSSKWSNLDGKVENGYGKWIGVSDFMQVILPVTKKYKITTTFDFKNQDLKSMECKILYIYGKEDVFVEMYKNIGGGSCDGLGKTGHCIVLPRKILKEIHSGRKDKLEDYVDNLI